MLRFLRLMLMITFVVSGRVSIAADRPELLPDRQSTWLGVLLQQRELMQEEPAVAPQPVRLPDFGEGRYTLAAWIRTKDDGTIFAKCARQGRWSQGAKCLFIADGRVCFDIGWVGCLHGETQIDDGRWHHVVFTGGQPQRVYVDGQLYFHQTDDMHPCYLPDGRIVFTSTRCEYGTLCDAPDHLATAVLYRVDSDGRNMVRLTNSAVSEFLRIGYVGGDIRDCTYKNLVIHSNRGISLFVRGGDSIENISFSDIIIRSRLVTGHWWGQAEPIHISAVPWHPEADALGTISNVRFSNILAGGQSGIVVHGDESSRIQNLSFNNIRLKLKDGPLQSAYGVNFDLRAAKAGTKRVFARDIPALYCRHAEGLRINGLQIAWDDAMPEFFNHALQLEDVSDVVIEGFEGRQPHRSGQAISPARVSKISIRDSTAAEGTDTFVSHLGLTDARLFINNDLLDTKTVFEPADVGFAMTGTLVPKR